MICVPRALVSLTFCFNDDSEVTNEDTPVTNAELYGLLLNHRDTLKYLDVSRDCINWTPPTHPCANSYMSSLREFTKLKTLLIQPEVLLGGCCNSVKATSRLKEVLPECLQSLTFYGKEGLATNRDLDGQLMELVEGTHFADLRSIVLEDVEAVLERYPEPVDLPRHSLEKACIVSEVMLRIVYGGTLPKGGSMLPWSLTKGGCSNDFPSRLKGWGVDPYLDDDESEETDSVTQSEVDDESSSEDEMVA